MIGSLERKKKENSGQERIKEIIYENILESKGRIFRY